MGKFCGIDPLWIDEFIEQLHEEKIANQKGDSFDKDRLIELGPSLPYFK